MTFCSKQHVCMPLQGQCAAIAALKERIIQKKTEVMFLGGTSIVHRKGLNMWHVAGNKSIRLGYGSTRRPPR